MDKSPSSRTPSPSVASATSRGNPFSIDYILSSSAVAAAVKSKQQQPMQPMHQIEQVNANALDQLNLMNQQRAQLMAAAAAAAAHSNELHHHQLQQQQQQQTSSGMQQIKIAQQHQPNPNFLYIMACMLLNQQQQQQNHHRQQQQQQVVQRQASEAAALVANQQLANRQPMDLARSPMESLSILARLTGGPTAAILSAAAADSTAGFAKNSRFDLDQPSTNRHQPYPLPPVNGRHQATFQSPIVALNHSIGPVNNKHTQLPALNLLNNNQRRSSPLINQDKPSSGQSSMNDFNNAFNNLSNNSSTTTITNNNNNTNSSSASSQNNTSTNSHGDKLDNLKPAHSYIGLIGMCILSSPEKRMVLNDIYQFILDNYPYYRNRGSGWRNSVRHNLSLNECFQKAGRAANGKGHYWTIHPANMEDFMMGDFRRRRAQRKVRRWNNMDVPSDESEDESMEDATKPPLPEHFKRSLEMHRRLELSYQKTAVATSAAFVAAQAANQAATLGLPPLPPPGSCSPLFRKQNLS